MRSRRIYWALGLLTLLLAAAAPWYDRPWSDALMARPMRAFAAWMEQSMFEGEGFGGSDLGQLVPILSALGYLVYARRKLEPAHWLRGTLAYAASATLLATVLLIHLPKYTIARARPYQVYGKAQQPYSEWYQVRSERWGTRYSGSFTSGHVAATCMTFPLALVLAHSARRRTRMAGWMLGAGTLALALAMAIARVMARKHWLSDGLMIIPISAMFYLAYYEFFFGRRARNVT